MPEREWLKHSFRGMLWLYTRRLSLLLWVSINTPQTKLKRDSFVHCRIYLYSLLVHCRIYLSSRALSDLSVFASSTLIRLLIWWVTIYIFTAILYALVQLEVMALPMAMYIPSQLVSIQVLSRSKVAGIWGRFKMATSTEGVWAAPQKTKVWNVKSYRQNPFATLLLNLLQKFC